jgi:hypothetical protein
MLLAGCNSISIRLTDGEVEFTDKGFKVTTDDYTDILINQPQRTEPESHFEDVNESHKTLPSSPGSSPEVILTVQDSNSSYNITVEVNQSETTESS